jgi:ribosomal-protein-alanine N-acetyltransferase
VTPPAAGRPAALRDARWTDVPALLSLEAELFPHDAWSETTWWAELAGRPRREYVVAEDAHGVCGYAGLTHGGDVADIMTVGVSPRAQGRGLGRLLVDELERRARGRAAASVLLEVRADNIAARSLYDASGYTVLTTRQRYYQPGDVDALVMRKLLTGRDPHGA